MLVFSLNFYSFQRLNYAYLRLLHVNRVNVSPIYLFVALLLRYFYQGSSKGRQFPRGGGGGGGGSFSRCFFGGSG